MLIQAIDLPQTAANPIPDHSMAQLFAHRNAHPVCRRPIGPGINNQIGIGHTACVIEPAENMVKFQRTGKFHKITLVSLPKGIPAESMPNKKGSGANGSSPRL